MEGSSLQKCSSTRLQEKRDSARETVRDKHHQSMLAKRRATIVEVMDDRMKDPVSHEDIERFASGTYDPVNFINKIWKFAIAKNERKRLYRYFTPATVRRLCQLLIQARTPHSQEDQNVDYRRRILGILNNFFMDNTSAEPCCRLIYELMRMYQEEDVAMLRCIAITCLGNMCFATQTQQLLWTEFHIVCLLGNYKFNSEDSEDVFYLINRLCANLTQKTIWNAFELMPMFTRVFFEEATADLTTQQSILEMVARFAQSKQPFYYEQFAEVFSPFFVKLCSQVGKGEYPIQLTAVIIDCLYEIYKDVKTKCKQLINPQAVGLFADLLVKPEEGDQKAIATSYRKIIKSLVTIARFDSSLILANYKLKCIIEDNFLEDNGRIEQSERSSSIPKQAYFEFIYFILEVMLHSKKNPVCWSVCCRHVISCLEDQPELKAAVMVQELHSLFEKRLELLGVFAEKGGVKIVSKMSRYAMEQETRDTCLEFVLTYDSKPTLPLEE